MPSERQKMGESDRPDGCRRPDGGVPTVGRVHDYTTPARKWGHDIAWTPENGGLVLKATGWGLGVKPQDFFLLSNGDTTARYRVAQIDYYRDPPDMWNARLEFAPRALAPAPSTPHLGRTAATIATLSPSTPQDSPGEVR